MFEFINCFCIKRPNSSLPLIYESEFEKELCLNNLPWGVMPGELLDIIPGDDIGAPETGVPGLLLPGPEKRYINVQITCNQCYSPRTNI